MTVITYERPARCGDCIFLKRKVLLKKDGQESRLKRHHCTNTESEEFTMQRSMSDRVCDNWKLG